MTLSIRFREVYILLPFRGNRHASHNHICLAALQGNQSGVKCHIVNTQLHAQLIGNRRRNLSVNAHNSIILPVLIGRELRVGSHHQRFLFLFVRAAAIVCLLATLIAAASRQAQQHSANQQNRQ